MPSWAGVLNGTYGYPLFIFLNPLPYYLTSLFHFIGFSFISSLKLFLGATYLLSGIATFYLVKQILKKDLAAFTAAVFYLFFPYHLVDLHFRNDVGEMLCFALLPIFLLLVYKLFFKQKLIYLLWSGLLLGLLLLSHQAIALLSLGLVIPFSISLIAGSNKINRISSLTKLFLALLLGITVSAYVWLTYITYSAYNLSSGLFRQLPSFINIKDLLYSPWRLGFLFQGPKGELSFLIGYTQIFIIGFFIVYLLVKKTKAKFMKETFIWLFTTLFIIFMLTRYSAIIWLTVPVIKDMLMTSRLLLALSFSVSILAGYFVVINQKWKILIWLVIVITIGSTILNWGHRRVIPQISDTQLINNLPRSTYYGEGLSVIGNTIWFSNKPIWFNQVPASKIEVIQGNAQIKVLNITNVQHFYTINSTTGARLKENTLYYPGWNVTVNGKPTTIDFTDKKYHGIITFTIPKGNVRVKVAYKDLPMLQILKYLFICSLIIIFGYTCLTICKTEQLITKLKRVRKRFS